MITEPDTQKYAYALITHDGEYVISGGYHGNENNLRAFPNRKSGEHYIKYNGGNASFKLKKVKIK